MEESNLMANISAGSAVALAVLYVIGMCIGFIPFVGLLAIFLYPIDWILALTAVITGVLGFQASKNMDGVGQPQSIAGIVVGGLFICMQALLLCLVGGVGFLAVFAEMM